MVNVVIPKLTHVAKGIGAIFRIRARWFFKRAKVCTVSDSNFLISITSYRPRFRFLRLTLCTLILQNIERVPIYVFLFQQDYEVLPKYLLNLQYSGVTFVSITENMRVYLKLFPALNFFPDKYIITFDDDIDYSGNYLQLLLDTSRRNPESVIGHRGLIFPTDPRSIKYENWREISGKQISSFSGIMLTGVGGVVYPPNFRKVIDTSFEEASRYSPTADDLWYFYFEESNKIHRVCLGTPLGEPKTWLGSQQNALWRLNVSNNLNDEIVSTLQKISTTGYFHH